jgi:hypothetical protein
MLGGCIKNSWIRSHPWIRNVLFKVICCADPCHNARIYTCLNLITCRLRHVGLHHFNCVAILMSNVTARIRTLQHLAARIHTTPPVIPCGFDHADSGVQTRVKFYDAARIRACRSGNVDPGMQTQACKTVVNFYDAARIRECGFE